MVDVLTTHYQIPKTAGPNPTRFVATASLAGNTGSFLAMGLIHFELTDEQALPRSTLLALYYRRPPPASLDKRLLQLNLC